MVGGKTVELPMLREKYKSKPPCDTCPKLQGVDDKKPLADDVDFGEWFFECRRLYREGRAVGFGRVDPLMRAVFAEFDAAERALERKQLISVLLVASRK